jgi:hypothetical protein
MFPIPKPIRFTDDKLLAKVRTQSCVACGKPGPSDPHHLTTRGHGGGDLEDNLIALCRKHHTEVETIGIRKFCRLYACVRFWLIDHKRNDLLGE